MSREFVEVEKLCERLRDLVESYVQTGRKVALWGAGHRTLALMSLSHLKGSEYVVDSARFKQGKFTPVLHFRIVPPGYLVQKPVDLIIVMVPGIYPGEVLSSIEELNLSADIAVLKDNEIEILSR